MIPERTKRALQAWVEHGQLPGGFCAAVISNDLTEAVNRADDENLAALPEIVRWLYNKAPCGCWGSPEHVKNWPEYLRSKANGK